MEHPLLQLPPSVVYPVRRGEKSGLYRTKIGLRLPRIEPALFRSGRLKVECVGEVEDGGGGESGALKGTTRHNVHRIVQEEGADIRLPEALKREMTEVYVGELT